MAQSVLGKINYLTDAQYRKAKAEGSIDPNQIYLTPDGSDIKDYVNRYTEPNYIVATISTSKKITSNARIALDTIVEQSGTKLSLVSGAVKIGEGVSKVRISASFFIDNWIAGASYGWGKIRKNGSNVAGTINSSSAAHISTPVATTIVSVESGDLLEIVFEGPAESTARAGRSNTWLCVESIE